MIWAVGYCIIGVIWASIWNRWFVVWYNRGDYGYIAFHVFLWFIGVPIELVRLFGEFGRK
jgi:hypothetical protein